jgi:nitrogen regulatory protein PII
LMDSDYTIDYLTVITARKNKENVLKLLLNTGCHLIDVVYAKGTVQSGYMKDMVGLVAEEKKIMITCLLKSNITPQLMEQFVTKLNFDQPNTGIAFVIPVEKLSI